MTDVEWRLSCLSGPGLLAVAIAASGIGLSAAAAAPGPAATQAALAPCGWLDPFAAAKFSAIAADCPMQVGATESDSSAGEPGALAPQRHISQPISVAVPFGNRSRRLGVRPAVIANLPSPRPSGLIAAVAASHRIDPLLLGAIVARESAGRPDAVSPKGALGLMQVMPATAAALGIADPAQLRDPATSLVAGATYLKQMQARFGGNLALTLAAYNAGPGAVAKYRGVPPYAETRAYVTNILGRYRAARASGAPRYLPASGAARYSTASGAAQYSTASGPAQ